MIAAWYWWLLGWGSLVYVGIGAVAGLLLGVVKLYERLRRLLKPDPAE